MTSKWLASKIEEGLGLFFEDVDSERITCALWAGRIELTDLKVKASALDKLDLPFPVSLVASSIKRLVLEINWKIITAPPVTIELDGVEVELALLSGTRNGSTYNSISAAGLSRKAARVHRCEWALLKSSRTRPSLTERMISSLSSHMTAKILQNLEVSISNFHMKLVIGGEAIVLSLDHIGVTSITLAENDFAKKVSISSIQLEIEHSDTTKRNLLVPINCFMECSKEPKGEGAGYVAKLFIQGGLHSVISNQDILVLHGFLQNIQKYKQMAQNARLREDLARHAKWCLHRRPHDRISKERSNIREWWKFALCVVKRALRCTKEGMLLVFLRIYDYFERLSSSNPWCCWLNTSSF